MSFYDPKEQTRQLLTSVMIERKETDKVMESLHQITKIFPLNDILRVTRKQVRIFRKINEYVFEHRTPNFKFFTGAFK